MNRISSTVDRFPQGKLRVRSQKHFYCSKNPSASTFSSSGVKAPDWSSIAEQIQRRAVFDPAAHRSSPVIPGPTEMFQKSLMRLPVPKLEDTCTRYLSAVCPLVDSSTFESTRSRVEAFQKGIGQQLQRELVAMDKKNRHTSYINQDWFHLYLSDRKPLPIHYNPFLTMRNEEAQYKPEALEKAALFIAILTQWYYRYRRGQVAPEAFFFGSSKHYAHQPWFLNLFQYIPSALRTPAIMFSSRFHVFPLDMVQFHNAFATSRIPSCDGVDTIKCFADENPTHVLINYGGRQYTVQVCFSPSDAEDVLQSTANVLTSLKAIVAQHPVPADEEMLRERVEEVGVLTSERRDVWARLRNHLESNPHNALSLKKIDSALFAFSLDLEDPTPGDLTKRSDVIRLARNQMGAPTNRWWDKSFSLLINQSGVVAMNFEHSWGDGVAILRIIVDLYNQYMTNVATYKQAMSNLPSEDLSRRGVSNAWERVSFVLDATTKSSIVSARDRLVKEINNVDYYVNVYPDLGKRNSLFWSEIKPDPFVQLAFQLAWYRLYRNTVSTYESASTSAFLHGRTECIRSATNESKAFTIAMEEGRHKDAALFEMLLKSVRKHAQNSKEAKMGQGIDRHLFALRKMAQRMNVAEPDVFDASYQTLTLNMMSTSTLASDALMMGGFGPVSPGYGIGYSVADDLILFSISSWKPNAGGPAFGCEAFAQVLYQTVSDLHQLCLRNMKK